MFFFTFLIKDRHFFISDSFIDWPVAKRFMEVKVQGSFKGKQYVTNALFATFSTFFYSKNYEFYICIYEFNYDANK